MDCLWAKKSGRNTIILETALLLIAAILFLDVLLLTSLVIELRSKLQNDYPREFERAGKPSSPHDIFINRMITFYSYILFRDYRRIPDTRVVRQFEVARYLMLAFFLFFVLGFIVGFIAGEIRF